MPKVKRKIMSAEFVDCANYPKLAGPSTKELLFNGTGYHVWLHVDEPGKKGPMHKHTADQLFYCVQGECTYHFPNGETEKLEPGMVVTIPAGQLYQLDNTGDTTMILLGSRAESAGNARHTKDDDVIKTVDGEYVVQNRT